MGIKNRMTGTSWHVETLRRADGDDRRHRSRCSYFEKKDSLCRYIMAKCPGSAHCTWYKEKEQKVFTCVSGQDDSPIIQQKANKKKQQKEDKIVPQRIICFPEGSKVRHRQYGQGTVTKIADGKVYVMFDNGEQRTFGHDVCVERKLLVIVEK